MARLEKYGRKYVEGGFNLEDYMQQNYSRDPANKDKMDKGKDNKKENLTLADIPEVDCSKPKVMTFIKDSDDD